MSKPAIRVGIGQELSTDPHLTLFPNPLSPSQFLQDLLFLSYRGILTPREPWVLSVPSPWRGHCSYFKGHAQKKRTWCFGELSRSWDGLADLMMFYHRFLESMLGPSALFGTHPGIFTSSLGPGQGSVQTEGSMLAGRGPGRGSPLSSGKGPPYLTKHPQRDSTLQRSKGSKNAFTFCSHSGPAHHLGEAVGPFRGV